MFDLITTPAYPYANSYLTLREAEEYYEYYNRIPADASWRNLTDNQKKYALILAAHALNELTYKGAKFTPDQPLAFPRITWFEKSNGIKKTYNSFDDAVNSSNLVTILTNAYVEAINNSFIILESGITYPVYLRKLNVIKIDGFYFNSGYFSIKEKPSDTMISVFEDVENEMPPSGGVDMYLTPIPAVPENVKFAQAELAWQLIDVSIFQKNILDASEPPIRSFNLWGAITIHYQSKYEETKFSTQQTTPIDIVKFLLSPWLGIGGRIV